MHTNMCPKNRPNVGKYTIHGSYGQWSSVQFSFSGASSQDAAEAANAAASEGSFSRLTHAAEFYASQAATQAAGLFSYKKTDEGQERRMQADQWQPRDQKGWCVVPWLDPVPVRFLL